MTIDELLHAACQIEAVIDVLEDLTVALQEDLDGNLGSLKTAAANCRSTLTYVDRHIGRLVRTSSDQRVQ